jgi:hypothetical protein
MNKVSKRKEIVDHLIELKENEIKALEESYKIFAESADLDEESVLQDDDFSKQDQSNNSAINILHRIELAKENLENFKQAGHLLVDEITNGSVVLTNKINFVIGLAIKDFLYKDEKYVGISMDAPIFTELQFKKEGDTFTFTNTEYTIKEIL